MNKSNPNSAVDAFVGSATNALADWKVIDQALSSHGIQLRRRAAADSFVALAVSWETFISNWVVACVNRDSSVAVARLNSQLRDYAIKDVGVPEGHVAGALITKPHLTLAEVRRMLSPNDYNVPVRSHGNLHDLATRWFAEPYRGAALGISSFQFCPAVLTRLVRNVFAHRSVSSLAAANDVAAQTSTPISLRWTGDGRLDVDGWRRYLLTANGTVSRLEVLHNNLSDLAGSLKVS